MNELTYEERIALREISDANEKLGYLLSTIEDAIRARTRSQKVLTDAYQEVVVARGCLRKASQAVDEYMGQHLADLVDDSGEEW